MRIDSCIVRELVLLILLWFSLYYNIRHILPSQSLNHLMFQKYVIGELSKQLPFLDVDCFILLSFNFFLQFYIWYCHLWFECIIITSRLPYFENASSSIFVIWTKLGKAEISDNIFLLCRSKIDDRYSLPAAI